MGYLGNQITTVFPTSISVDSATISGNTTVGGTLGVTGATTLSNQLTDANMASGSVLQAVTSTRNTTQAESSNSFVTSSLAVAITPRSTSSKIFLTGTLFMGVVQGGQIHYNIYRDHGGTDALVTTVTYGFGGFHINGSGGGESACPVAFLDSPSRTDEITYTIYVQSTGTDNAQIHDNNRLSTLIAMEIQG